MTAVSKGFLFTDQNQTMFDISELARLPGLCASRPEQNRKEHTAQQVAQKNPEKIIGHRLKIDLTFKPG